MSLQDRIEALKAKHHALEAALEAENSRPRPDDGEISRLKKQKLQIKDEIATLSPASTSALTRRSFLNRLVRRGARQDRRTERDEFSVRRQCVAAHKAQCLQRAHRCSGRIVIRSAGPIGALQKAVIYNTLRLRWHGLTQFA